VAIVAIVLMSRSDRSERSDRSDRAGVGLALLSGVTVGLFFLFLERTSSDAGLWPLIAGRLTSVPLFGVVALAGRHSLRMEPGVAVTAQTCGGLDMLANVFYLLATRYGPLSLVVTLASLYPASTVLLARQVLGERLTRAQALGVIFALAAVVLIVRSA
jgi:drug/metabolite transporter (DMT)-like permease